MIPSSSSFSVSELSLSSSSSDSTVNITAAGEGQEPSGVGHQQLPLGTAQLQAGPPVHPGRACSWQGHLLCPVAVTALAYGVGCLRGREVGLQS